MAFLVLTISIRSRRCGHGLVLVLGDFVDGDGDFVDAGDSVDGVNCVE
jgi:hypothetical protein